MGLLLFHRTKKIPTSLPITEDQVAHTHQKPSNNISGILYSLIIYPLFILILIWVLDFKPLLRIYINKNIEWNKIRSKDGNMA